MLDVSELANEKLLSYLKTNGISSSLRVIMMQSGCQGLSLGLALDEEKEGDESYKVQNLTFLVEKSLLQKSGSITIDYLDTGSRPGFIVRSEKTLAAEGDVCRSGACGSKNCGS